MRATLKHSLLALCLAASASVLACSTAVRRDPVNDDADEGSSSGSVQPGPGEQPGNSTGGLDTPEPEDHSNRIELRGTTYAPNGTLQLGNTLVYWTATEPAPIPEGVYCDECVQVAEGTSAMSGADGSFSLRVPKDVDVFLVVQKGQFRRVRKVRISEGQQTLDRDWTTLPGATGQGDTVPKIAIMSKETSTTYDMIWDALDKLGVREYTFLTETGGSDQVTQIDALRRHHIVMLNCGGRYRNSRVPHGPPPEDSALRQYIEEGGKVYVSDHALDYIHGIMPGLASLSTAGIYHNAGRFEDEGLHNWMQAIGETSVRFTDSYSQVNELKHLVVSPPMSDGGEREVHSKIWARHADNRIASFSFAHGCGRGMFSTFHAHPDGNALTAQEKALLYMLLEVSACSVQGPTIQ